MKKLILSLAAIAALILSGCQSTGVNTVSSSTGGTDYAWYTPDSDTKKHVFVESANTAEIAGGITKVQVVLKNNAQQERAFNYVFEWTDENGFIVKNSNSSWKTVRLKPRETITITGISPKTTAKGYTLKLEKTI